MRQHILLGLNWVLFQVFANLSFVNKFYIAQMTSGIIRLVELNHYYLIDNREQVFRLKSPRFSQYISFVFFAVVAKDLAIEPLLYALGVDYRFAEETDQIVFVVSFLVASIALCRGVSGLAWYLLELLLWQLFKIAIEVLPLVKLLFAVEVFGVLVGVESSSHKPVHFV